MKINKAWIFAGLSALAIAWSAGAAAVVAKDANETFPLRTQYRVPVIETAELKQRFDQVVVVDVRSKYEFDTLRIKDALHISVTDRNFVQDVRALRAKSNKPIVFYCNGKTCRKSYDAVVLASKMQVTDLLCYDAGIADWAQANPDKTALFGKSPIQPGTLISQERFKERLLDPKEFEARLGPKALAIDVRDRVQRDTLLFPGRELRAQLDDNRMLSLIIEKAKTENKTLLVYDQVGKQVEWFQYYLESKGVKDYYFMKGGAQAYFEAFHGKALTAGKKSEGVSAPAAK